MKPYLKTIAKCFLNTFHENEISAAKIELFLYEEEGIEDQLDKLLTEYFCPSPKDKEMLAAIEQTDEPEQILILMKKAMCGDNRMALRKKVLSMEETITPYLLEKVLRNRQDHFVENCLHFFLFAKKDYTEWIYEHYSEIRSEYMKSMLCVALGVRGKAEYIPFLISECKRFLAEYPDESFDQGPYLAVKELVNRS